MIAAWMLAAMALAAVLGAAAWTLERALRLLGRQGRAPWAVAIAAAVSWPLLAPLMRDADVQSATVRAISLGAGTTVVGSDAPESWTSALWTWMTALDRPLLILWLLASALLLVRVLWAVAALHRLARRAPASTIDQTEVRLTHEIGPAVFALWRAELLLPHWLLELDPSLRRMVMDHEREHVRAYDAQLVVGTFVLVALVPWNLPLWWLAHRLRTAAELDCDVRVLRAGADAHTYGQLLLLIAQRQGNARFLPMMAGAPSTLRARIIAMSTPNPKRPAVRAATLTVASVALLAAAAHPALARPLASAHFGAALETTAPVADLPEIPVIQEPSRAQSKPAPDSGKRAPKAPAAAKSAAQDFKEFKLDRPAALTPGSKAPRYPNELRKANVTGSVLAMFVVDTSGRPDVASLKIVRATHPEFVDAVRESLPGHKFLPALVGDRPVRQLVQVRYRFATFSKPVTDAVKPVEDVALFDILITGNDKAGDPSGYEVTKTVTESMAEPTYFVDGKRTPADVARKLDKSKIASVEVLKNEAARAKYGDDGKNGVVLITTKP
ncbi:MAG: energy transducer TonB [Gemmatimonadaceae bacterium]|nr:energy transducer TonB [Gemmatimonadaceae bacterium]